MRYDRTVHTISYVAFVPDFANNNAIETFDGERLKNVLFYEMPSDKANMLE